MIIIGYQGIGKSSIARVNPFTSIDLESSWTKIDGQRPDEWAQIYCQIAEGLSRAGYNVFVSSHKVVQDILAKSSEHVLAVFPSLDIKDEWLERLRLRWEVTGDDKNLRAWKGAEAGYDDEIRVLMDSPFEKYIIGDMNYRLEGVITAIVNKPGTIIY